MNRHITEAQSGAADARLGEAAHRHILGVYTVLGELTAKFPKVRCGGRRNHTGLWKVADQA